MDNLIPVVRMWHDKATQAEAEVVKQQSYIRKLKAEIRMLQIRVREANRGARNSMSNFAHIAQENSRLRKEIAELNQKKRHNNEF